ncbi:MAG: hypothetical protein ACRDPA_09925, partial [Solirubrobacteraceae bacterium]
PGVREDIHGVNVADLVGPFEILELNAGESRSMTIVSAQLGTMTIHPANAPAGKLISALRVNVDQADKPTFPYYWDVTSQTLIAQLAPQVTFAGYRPKRFTVTKVGAGPAARFQLAVEPAVQA